MVYSKVDHHSLHHEPCSGSKRRGSMFFFSVPVWAASSSAHLLLQHPHFLLLCFNLISNKSLNCLHFTAIYNINIWHNRLTCTSVASKPNILNIFLLLPFSAVLYLCLMSATIIAMFPPYPVVRCCHGYVRWWLGLSTNQKLSFWFLTNQRESFCYAKQLDSIKHNDWWSFRAEIVHVSACVTPKLTIHEHRQLMWPYWSSFISFACG